MTVTLYIAVRRWFCLFDCLAAVYAIYLAAASKAPGMALFWLAAAGALLWSAYSARSTPDAAKTAKCNASQLGTNLIMLYILAGLPTVVVGTVMAVDLYQKFR